MSDAATSGAAPPRPASEAVSDRIPAVPRAQWTDEVREVFSVFEGEEGRELGSKFNVVHMCAHHPKLATTFFRYSKGLLDDPLISGRLRELVILRVAWRNRCEYEWVQHVEISRAFGLGEDHLEAVRFGAEHPIFAELERNLLRAVDQLAETASLDQDLWDALAKELGHAQMLELLFLIGTYTLMAWAFNAAGLKLEPGLAAADLH